MHQRQSVNGLHLNVWFCPVCKCFALPQEYFSLLAKFFNKRKNLTTNMGIGDEFCATVCGQPLV